MDKIHLLITCTILFFEFYLLLLGNVDAQAVVANKELSSPNLITAMKNSNVWLHWNYTYFENNFVDFQKQQWTINDTSLNAVIVIAEKTTLNGQIIVSSSLPNAMVGRITAFSDNNTLGIKNLQYNDTLLHFKSTVFAKGKTSSGELGFNLVPTVNLNIEGVPEYLSTPSRNIEVTENGLLSVDLHFDGIPKPKAEAEWSGSNAKISLTVSQEYPFVYKTEYSMNQIASSFCGKTLALRAQNSVGKASDINVAVTVLLSLSNPSLRAAKPNQSCVEVEWQKKESGLCNVTYTVNFKDKNGTVEYTNTEINKSGTTRCGIPSNMDIDQVELIMSSTKRSKTFTALVSEKPLPTLTTVPKKKGVKYGAIIGGTIGGLLAVILLVLFVIYFLKRGKWSPGSQDKSQFLQLNAKSADSTTVEQSKRTKSQSHRNILHATNRNILSLT